MLTLMANIFLYRTKLSAQLAGSNFIVDEKNIMKEVGGRGHH